MTIANLTSRGSGSIALRLSIEGFPVDFVNSKRLVGTGSDGRERAHGLSVAGVKIKQEADLPRATLKAGGATFQIADIGVRATAAFDTAPTATTWLAGFLDESDTTSMTVKSTNGFPTAGTLYLDSEVITYTNKTSTTFTGLTRGVWDTLAQAHYTPDGARQRFPEVTDQPTVIEGRRARLFLYTGEDSATGDGEQVWLGIVRGEPRMQGPTWSILVDSISSVLDAEIGADLAEPVTPRGIYYPAVAPWWVNLGTVGPGSGVQPITRDLVASVVGFFETQADFVAAANAAIAVVTSGWATTIQVVADPNGYHFEVQTTSTLEGVDLQTNSPPSDPFFQNHTFTESAIGPGATISGSTLVASTRYYVWPTSYPMPGCGQVPRGSFVPSPDGLVPPAAATWPGNRIYFGGATGISSNVTSVIATWQDATSSVDREYRLESIHTATRRGELVRNFSAPPGTVLNHAYTPGNLPSFRLGRQYNDLSAGSLRTGTHELMQALTDNAPVQVNTGAQPMIQAGDWDAAAWLAAYDGAVSIAKDRAYTSLKPGKLIEYIAPDLQLHGHYLAIDSSGRLTIKRLRLASPTETSTFQIDKSNLITKKGNPTFERGAIGVFNTMVIRNGYSAKEDDYTESPYVVRDVTSYGRTPNARAVLIEPKSQALGTTTYDDAVRIADGVLGIYGNPYAYVMLGVPLTALSSCALGDTVSIDTKQLPSGAGTRGTTDTVGLVTAREIDLYAGVITLTLLVSRARIAGYAPSAKISSQSGSGDTWDITLSSVYFESGDSAENHLETGDRVTVFRYDSLTSGQVEGAVTGVTGNVVSVDFDASWTPSTDEWIFSACDGDNNTLQDGQKRYAYVGDSVALLDFTPDVPSPARVFAP